MPRRRVFPLRLGFLLRCCCRGGAGHVASYLGMDRHWRGDSLDQLLLVAILPLTLAAVGLCFQRFRFSLRILLIATALVAVFMYATVLPCETQSMPAAVAKHFSLPGRTSMPNRLSRKFTSVFNIIRVPGGQGPWLIVNSLDGCDHSRATFYQYCRTMLSKRSGLTEMRRSQRFAALHPNFEILNESLLDRHRRRQWNSCALRCHDCLN